MSNQGVESKEPCVVISNAVLKTELIRIWNTLTLLSACGLCHPIMKKLSDLKTSNPRLAQLVAEQVFDNAMITAGLIEDPRTMLTRMNELLTIALEKN